MLWVQAPPGINIRHRGRIETKIDRADIALQGAEADERAIEARVKADEDPKLSVNEVFVHVFPLGGGPPEWVIRVAPKGHVPEAEWWLN